MALLEGFNATDCRLLTEGMISQVYFNLGELDDALSYALSAGSLFDVSERSEYVQSILGADYPASQSVHIMHSLASMLSATLHSCGRIAAQFPMFVFCIALPPWRLSGRVSTLNGHMKITMKQVALRFVVQPGLSISTLRSAWRHQKLRGRRPRPLMSG